MAQKGTGSFEQAILNSSFNPDTGLLQVETMGTDGAGSRVNTSDVVAQKITEVGSVIYIGIAKPGALQSESIWRCCKVDKTTGTTTWADLGNFSQTSSNLTALVYT